MDEFEIEITPLDGSEEEGEADWSWSGGTKSRSPFDPYLSQRGKLTRMATACSAVVLVCALLVALSPALRGALGSLLPAAGTAAHSESESPPGSEDIYFENGVPWGKLLLDGHKVTHAADHMIDHLTVGPGLHTLAYNDPPFAPLHCQFQVPFSMQDSCPLEFTPPAPSVANGLYVRIINLSATPDRLPLADQTALISTVDASLDVLTTTTLVPAGALYLSGADKPTVANHPLLATLRFRVNTNPHVVAPYLPGGHFCSQICYLGEGIGTPEDWGLLALADVSWNYTLLNGSIIERDAPASPAPNGSTALVTIGATWAAGTWHAVALPGHDQFGVSPICDVATTLVPPTPLTGFMPTDYTQDQIPAATPANGCVITMRPNIPGAMGATAYLLYRFGVLLAANSAAKQLYPELPVGNSRDTALAAEILSNPVGG